MPQNSTTTVDAASNKHFVLRDTLLIGIMAALAACGLIYEYLLSHYAGYVLGGVESTIYTMIGLMIVSMGLGAFAARLFKNPFSAFLKLELLIALSGNCAILLIASFIALSHWFPIVLSETFQLPQDIMPNSGFFATFEKLTKLTPYVAGFFIGLFIGMEIPLIARVREHLYQRHLTNNAGTIYGADYIGAGFGAAIWVLIMLSMDITQAASLTAIANLVAGLTFMLIFRQEIKHKILYIGAHIFLLALSLVVFKQGYAWFTLLEDVLYKDHVIYSHSSHYQRITVTRRVLSSNIPPIYSLYLNGRLQFSSEDEHIYHSYLVQPVMLASQQHKQVLIIGGGDGLALRHVLTWNPTQVKLIDLDPELVQLFDAKTAPTKLTMLPNLNHNAFSDPRAHVIFGDAFIEIDKLLEQGDKFDSIIVDLPDPNHPDLNKLYSTDFYARLANLLNADGAIVIQSTSPYHAHQAFISIGKTVQASGFSAMQQYHVNVPSFGEWGFTIATKNAPYPLERIQNSNYTLPDTEYWLTNALISSAFEFPANFYNDRDQIKINRLGTNTLYQYHFNAWQSRQGTLYENKLKPNQ